MTVDHKTCLPRFRFLADQSGLDMEVTDVQPTRGYPEFPTQAYRCPHGVRMWALPTEAEAARLRALNAGGTK